MPYKGTKKKNPLTHCKRGHLRTFSGTKWECKVCLKFVADEWVKLHPDKVRTKKFKYNNAHREESRAYDKVRYWSDPEKHRKRAKDHRNDPIGHEAVLKAVQKWGKSNPDKRKATAHRRRARIAGSGGSYTGQEWLDLKEKYGNKCLCCGRTEEELQLVNLELVADHILPVSKGGTSSIDNIQPLCHALAKGSRGGCNNKKFDKYIDYR
jgi:hypothetical protein